MRINDRRRPEVVWHGGVVPVLTIDDFYLDRDEVRARAMTMAFEESRAMYAGRHSELRPDDPEVGKVLVYVREVLEHGTGIPVPAEQMMTDFSILTTDEEDLVPLQGHPHVDETPIIGVRYLNPNDLGGTNFYRNRELDLVFVRTEADRARLDAFHDHARDVPGYVVGSNALWEKIGGIEARYNRLVIYPGNAFHSIAVKRPHSPRHD